MLDRFASAELAPLWSACRRRLERNGLSLQGSPIVVGSLTPQEADAIAGLLGIRRPTSGTVRCRLLDVDRAVRHSVAAAGLVEVLEAIGGPLTDRRADTIRRDLDRRQLFSSLSDHPAVIAEPELAEWLEQIRACGLSRRLAGDAEQETLQAVLDVLSAIGAMRAQSRVVRLGILAAEVTGDAHGLDRGKAVATLTVHALARLARIPFPRDSAAWRRTWDSAGVACDDLSCDVLVLDLPGWASGPLRLTLRQVLAWDPSGASVCTVFVCENPAVVAAAADALPEGCPPMVCTDGMPSTAALAATRALTAAGARLVYHGDFDWPGLVIARVMAQSVGAGPWRYSAGDYRRAIDRGVGTVVLEGRPVDSPWDAELCPTMQQAGVAIYEEQVVGVLIDDLSLVGRG